MMVSRFSEASHMVLSFPLKVMPRISFTFAQAASPFRSFRREIGSSSWISSVGKTSCIPFIVADEMCFNSSCAVAMASVM